MSQGLGMVENRYAPCQEQESWQGDLEHQTGGGLDEAVGQRPSQFEPDAEYQHQTDGARDGRERSADLPTDTMMRVLCNGEESRPGKGILTPWACIHRS